MPKFAALIRGWRRELKMRLRVFQILRKLAELHWEAGVLACGMRGDEAATGPGHRGMAACGLTYAERKARQEGR